MHLIFHLREFFEEQAPLAAGDTLAVAFSGGPDSLALLLAMDELSRELHISLVAAHVDHGTGDGSASRARQAEELARRVSVPLTTLNAYPEGDSPRRDREADLRQRRYEALKRFRLRVGARYIATAHHRQDQVETVLLRLLYGSGVVGMAGILPRHGAVVRPLLGVARDDLRRYVAERSDLALAPVDDPTNRDMTISRNRLRHEVLPYLARRYPGIEQQASSLAETARRVRGPLLTTLLDRLEPEVGTGTLAIERESLTALPAALWPYALAALHRAAGCDYPPSAATAKELRRQIRQQASVGCAAGAGWLWRSRGSQLLLEQAAPPASSFTYTVGIPGAVDIAPLSLRLRLTQGPVGSWMFEGSRWRAGLNLPAKSKATVRTRRPGDRLQPLGCSYSRRLKDVLIDRHIPRDERDRLPLLVIDDAIAWVPGVTIAEPFRLQRDQKTAWIAEVVRHE